MGTSSPFGLSLKPCLLNRVFRVHCPSALAVSLQHTWSKWLHYLLSMPSSAAEVVIYQPIQECGSRQTPKLQWAPGICGATKIIKYCWSPASANTGPKIGVRMQDNWPWGPGFKNTVIKRRIYGFKFSKWINSRPLHYLYHVIQIVFFFWNNVY